MGWWLAGALYALGVVVMARRFCVLATVEVADEPLGATAGSAPRWCCALAWPVVGLVLVAVEAALALMCLASPRLARLARGSRSHGWRPRPS